MAVRNGLCEIPDRAYFVNGTKKLILWSSKPCGAARWTNKKKIDRSNDKAVF
jgi:hypothetical protein